MTDQIQSIHLVSIECTAKSVFIRSLSKYVHNVSISGSDWFGYCSLYVLVDIIEISSGRTDSFNEVLFHKLPLMYLHLLLTLAVLTTQ